MGASSNDCSYNALLSSVNCSFDAGQRPKTCQRRLSSCHGLESRGPLKSDLVTREMSIKVKFSRQKARVCQFRKKWQDSDLSSKLVRVF